MDIRDVERRMRAGEEVHGQTMEHRIFVLVRLDGRGFAGRTEALQVGTFFDGR